MTSKGTMYFLCVAIAVAFPFVLHGYLVFQATIIFVYAISIMGLYVLTGLSGQISVGHGAFFAAGAYSHAILMGSFELPFIVSLPLASIICFVSGYLFGWPALRLQGAYLALASFALSVALIPTLKLSLLETWTGGVMGLSVVPPMKPGWLPLSDDQWLYMIVLLAFCTLYALATGLTNSRTGRAMMAIRDNSLAAKAMGINIAFYKKLAFGLSAFFAGIGGALSATIVQYIAPDSFSFLLSIYFLVGLVVGGVAWLPGVIIGAAFIVIVPNISEGISQALAGTSYGILMMLFILALPKGLGGLVMSYTARAKTKRRSGPVADQLGA